VILSHSFESLKVHNTEIGPKKENIEAASIPTQCLNKLKSLKVLLKIVHWRT